MVYYTKKFGAQAIRWDGRFFHTRGRHGTIWTPGPNFPNSLFQITISPHHPVKQEPLRKILEKLPAKKKISLYFVVPEAIFETFTFQCYHNEQGRVSHKVPKSVEMIEQWVLGVPLKRLSKKEKAEQSEVQSIEKRAANEDDMKQPQTPKKRRTKLNAGETYQSQTPRKRGLNERKSQQSKAPRNNPTGRYNFRAKT